MKPELVFLVIFRESKLQLNYHVSNNSETPLELSHILGHKLHMKLACVGVSCDSL